MDDHVQTAYKGDRANLNFHTLNKTPTNSTNTRRSVNERQRITEKFMLNTWKSIRIHNENKYAKQWYRTADHAHVKLNDIEIIIGMAMNSKTDSVAQKAYDDNVHSAHSTQQANID